MGRSCKLGATCLALAAFAGLMPRASLAQPNEPPPVAADPAPSAPEPAETAPALPETPVPEPETDPTDEPSDPSAQQDPSPPEDDQQPGPSPSIPPVQPATAPSSPARQETPPAAVAPGQAAPPSTAAVEEDDGDGAEPATKPRLGEWLGLELSGGMNANHRFTTTDRGGTSEQALDSALAAALHLDFDAEWGLWLGYEHVGLGKERFDIDPTGDSLDARYAVDTLWLGARFYFDRTRPSWYAGVAVGPALQRVRGVGTRTPAAFNASGTPFECEEAGGLGAGLRAAMGAEVDLADRFSFVSDLSAVGHVLPGASDALDGCAPGAGPAIQGLFRVGLAYRLPL